MTPIFVYGTLKQGSSNHSSLAGQHFLGLARTVPGYRLYEVGGFPGMVAWPDDRHGVTGEVWSVSSPCLDELDALEGISEGLYQRVPVPLQQPFASLGAQTYLYLRSIAGRREIGETWLE